MAQNDYSVSLKLGNPDKSNKCKVYIRVSGEGREIKIPTIIKTERTFFNGKIIVDDPLADDMNLYLEGEVLKVRKALLDAHVRNIKITPDLFNNKGSGERLSVYVKKYLDDIHQKSTRAAVATPLNKLPDISINSIRGDFLKTFEKKLRSAGLDTNTINSQMKRTKAFISALIKNELINDAKIAKSLLEYHVPNYIQKIPEFLTEDEINNLFKLVRTVKNDIKRRAGYYFLLSCFTGWRLADLKSFDYNNRVRGENILLRAGKNNKIVSILIYPELKEVLSFCKSNSINFSEKEFREKVKELASDIGINQSVRKVTPHTGRHTFAMRLISKGFSIDEVAIMLGDSPEVARVYARITNTHLNNKIREALF